MNQTTWPQTNFLQASFKECHTKVARFDNSEHNSDKHVLASPWDQLAYRLSFTGARNQRCQWLFGSPEDLSQLFQMRS
uniref:Uncharacterized protein n=1 Tax=Physcomitrium patens TaxID=3218 RepID=A0A2K1JJ81_PHYPA|nr:hypothetical protein PHYPA_018789 [Physcomitrium patens]